MTPNGLQPAYVEIEYRSAYAPHVMVRPTGAWSPGIPETNVSGTFLSWNGDQIDADTMINDMVQLFQPFFLATTEFELYTVFEWDDAADRFIPRASQPLGLAGTSVSTSWAKAVSKTLNFRSVSGYTAKIVLLDVPSGNTFDPVNAFGADPSTSAVVDAFLDPDQAWSARFNEKPGSFLKQTTTLNDELRKQYHMV